jgi:hypothetical protein
MKILLAVYLFFLCAFVHGMKDKDIKITYEDLDKDFEVLNLDSPTSTASSLCSSYRGGITNEVIWQGWITMQRVPLGFLTGHLYTGMNLLWTRNRQWFELHANGDFEYYTDETKKESQMSKTSAQLNIKEHYKGCSGRSITFQASENVEGYKLYFFEDNGIDIKTDALKRWLSCASQEVKPEDIEDDGNEIILENITWECSSKVKEQTEEKYFWRVTESTRILSMDNSIEDLEKKINQLFKYAQYKEIPSTPRWYLALYGKFKNSDNMFKYSIPISLKIIEINTKPDINELNKVLEFGEFGKLVTSFQDQHRWDNLSLENLGLIKLFLFSQGLFTTNNLYEPDTPDNQENLLKFLLEKYKIHEDKFLCQEGHSNLEKNTGKEFDCSFCNKKSSGKIFHTRWTCKTCFNHPGMCQVCASKQRLGPRAQQRLKEYLQEKDYQMDQNINENLILKHFLQYISGLNWKIFLTKDSTRRKSNADLFELKQKDHTGKYLNENIQSLCARLSIFYHEFMMDTESNSEHLHTDWKFELDLTDLETTIIDYIKSEWIHIKTIPANSTETITLSVGYSNETQVSKEQNKRRNSTWSVKAAGGHIVTGSIEYGKTHEEIENTLNKYITTTTQTSTTEIKFESVDYDKYVYQLRFLGTKRSDGTPIIWLHPNLDYRKDLHDQDKDLRKK